MKQNHKTGDMKFYSMLANAARKQYDGKFAAHYRECDDLGADTRMHTTYCELLARVSSSLHRPISVLELGCGTGRYFHCLKNLTRLTGVDMSPDMLNEARYPVRHSKIAARVNLSAGACSR